MTRLAGLAARPLGPGPVLVTHHVEEIPAGFTHVLLLREGRVVAAGPLDEVLTGRNLSRDVRHAAASAATCAGGTGRAPSRPTRSHADVAAARWSSRGLDRAGTGRIGRRRLGWAAWTLDRLADRRGGPRRG